MVSWEEYGLEKNPFEAIPVEKNGVVPLETFEGRTKERQVLKQIIETKCRSLNLVFGDPGVGKTSFGNYVRQKMLKDNYFTTLKEVDCQPNQSTSEFIVDILYHIYSTIERTEQTNLEKVKKIIQPIYDSCINNNGAAKFSYAYLEDILRKVGGEIKKSGLNGIIIHANNLENFVQEGDVKFKKFLSAARDLFLMDGYHYIFIGNKEATDCFYSDSKVKTVVSSATKIDELTLSEVKAIVRKRYKAYQIETLKQTDPVSDDTITMLHEAHEGNIREVLSALDIAVQNAERGVKQDITITPDIARKTLRNYVEKEITPFSPKTLEVLQYIIKKKATNSEISEALNIIPQNTSSYLKELKNKDFIALEKKEKTKKIYIAKFKAIWLKFSIDGGVQQSLSEYYA